MAKKEGVWHEILGFFAKAALKGFLESIAETVKETTENIQRRLLRSLMAFFLFVLSIVFISIAFIILISQYLNLSRGWSYLIVGLILLLGGYKIYRGDDYGKEKSI